MDITQLLVPARINVAKYNGGQYLGVGLRTFARLRRVPGNKDEFASANAESRKTLSSSTSKLITSSLGVCGLTPTLITVTTKCNKNQII